MRSRKIFKGVRKIGKEDILKCLERAKYRMNKENAIGLSEMMAIMEALSYIIMKLDKETIIVEPVAAVEESNKPEAEHEKKKKPVDYGKIVALYKAGWTQKKIADEMGVGQNAISESLKRYKEKMKDGFIWDPEERKFIKKV